MSTKVSATRIEQAIDGSSLHPLQIRVFFLCGLIALLDGYDIQTMAFVVPSLAIEWGLAATDFKLALAGSLIGIAIGALAAGPISDRWGRKRVLVGALLILGFATLTNSWARNLDQLLIYRFLTGIGLGASMPNVIALTAEYAPVRYRTLAVTLMFCGVPLGSAIAGFMAVDLIANFGWQSVFVIGGTLPLLLAPICALCLAESIKYLANRPARHQHLQRLLDKMRIKISTTSRLTSTTTYSNPVVVLFSDGRAPITLILWGVFSSNLFAMYYIVSWLPTVLQSVGWSHANSLRGSAMFQLGGVISSVVFSLLIDRSSPFRVLPPIFICTAFAFVCMSVATAIPAVGLSVLTVCGAGVVGAQFCINALSAALYPTRARATGVGCALAVGRFGAIISPFVAAGMISPSSTSSYFLIGAVPAVLCACGVFWLGHINRPNI